MQFQRARRNVSWQFVPTYTYEIWFYLYWKHENFTCAVSARCVCEPTHAHMIWFELILEAWEFYLRRDRRAVCVSSHTHIHPCRANICMLACVYKICFHGQKFSAFILMLLKAAVPLLCLRPHIEHITSALSYFEFKSVHQSGYKTFSRNFIESSVYNSLQYYLYRCTGSNFNFFL